MPRIGITGHMNLTPETVRLVDQAIRERLSPYAGDNLVGVSCIARGADSIFAQAVLDLGGQLEVVLPSSNYRETKVKPDHTPQFDELRRRASDVQVMPFAEANREAYEAANEAMVGKCDRLIAVWDGHAAVDQGGTGALVEYARSRGVPIEIVWPEGAERR